MDFTMKDIALIATMSGAIIFMSFTFPALGLADGDETATESEIPEFNLSSSQFDIAGDFPDSPGTPQRGVVEYDEEVGASVDGMSLQWVDRPKDNGFSLELQNATTTDTFDLSVADWSNGNVVGEDRYEITSEGQTILHENMSWTIEFEVTELENYNEPNMTASVDYEILEASDDSGGGLSSIPVIGGLFSAGEQLASGIAWIGEVIWWAVAFIFEVSITIVLILVEIMLFAVGLMQWLLGSYFGVVTSAGSWASVVLMLPGIMLFLEFAKLAMLGIKLLPTT